MRLYHRVRALNKLTVRRYFSSKGTDEKPSDVFQNDVAKFGEKLTELKRHELFQKTREAFKEIKSDVIDQNREILADIKRYKDGISSAVSKGAEKVSAGAQLISEPIMTVVSPVLKDISKSKVAKSIAKTVDSADQSLIGKSDVLKYGGVMPKHVRLEQRKRLETEAASIAQQPSENVNATETRVVLKDSSKMEQLRKKVAEAVRSSILAFSYVVGYNRIGLSLVSEESNSIFSFFIREARDRIQSKFTSVFSESDTAIAIREIRVRDPSFTMELFLKDCRQYIVPEILEALLNRDQVGLQAWCSEAVVNVMKVTNMTDPEVFHRGSLVDLRNVEVILAKNLDDYPVVVFSFTAQQISYALNRLTSQVIDGSKDSIKHVNYVMALAKLLPPHNPICRGWRLVEISSREADSW